MNIIEPYHEDGLYSIHNHDFIEDDDFVKAYSRGVRAAGVDFNWRWRVMVGLWIAKQASKIEGDFVECGTGKGFLSSAILEGLDWNCLGKSFYLLDTYSGIDETQVSKQDIDGGAFEKNTAALEAGYFASDAEGVRENFKEWERVYVVEGVIPDTLGSVTSSKVSFLHIDLNCSPPEEAAIRFFWPKIPLGALILLDDYAYAGYYSQKVSMDRVGKDLGFEVLPLPSGQGLIQKWSD